MYIVDQRTHDTFLRSLSISGLVRFSVILQWNWAHGELGLSSGAGSVPVPLEGDRQFMAAGVSNATEDMGSEQFASCSYLTFSFFSPHICSRDSAT